MTTSTPGDHVYVRRPGYSHHGVDVGNGEVVHFKRGRVARASLDEFARGGRVRVRRHATADERDEVVARAAGCLGQAGYDLLTNNCEHFATWCVTGRPSCRQLRVAAGVGLVSAILLGLAGMRRSAQP